MANIICTNSLFSDVGNFNVLSNKGYNESRTCIYKGVGRCDEFEALLICNYHASWFDLYNYYRYFTNGMNDSWAKTETYARNVSNLWIPLFVDTDGTILMSEIRIFAEKIVKNDSTVKFNEVFERTAMLVGYTPTEFLNHHLSLSNCWLNKPSTLIILKTENDETAYIASSKIPPLHKILFYHTYPSIVAKNYDEPPKAVMVEKLILTFKEEQRAYGFTLTNKPLVLKVTDPSNPRYSMTPLVLAAEEFCDNEICLEKTFRKTMPNTSMGSC